SRANRSPDHIAALHRTRRAGKTSARYADDRGRNFEDGCRLQDDRDRPQSPRPRDDVRSGAQVNLASPGDPVVLIAGAGPTALTLALWLTKLGIRARIIDKNAEPAPYSRAPGVQARTLEFYPQLGDLEGDV